MTVPNIPHFVLRNGVQMPVIGLGTSHQGGYSHESVIHALKNAGYIHIDTAERYGSEQSIGEDIKASGVARETLFITTKVWPASYGYEEVKKSLACSLRNLKTDYVDLYLLHWPDVPSRFLDRKKCLKETWTAMEELYKCGRCRAIGVSNFLVRHLEELLPLCNEKPHVNQIEFNPYCHPKKLMEFCSSNRITVEGYCPLSKGMILRDRKLSSPIEPIAEAHGKSIAQILIRWSIQSYVVTIPNSTNVKRIEENIDVFDFTLTEEEMEFMDNLCNDAYIKATWDPEDLRSYRRHISNKVREN